MSNQPPQSELSQAEEGKESRPPERAVDNRKVAPVSAEAERALLGALMMDGDLLDETAELVTPRDFGVKKHRVIYESMCALAANGKAIDMVTVIQWLTDTRNLNNAGGADHVAELYARCVSTANVRTYAEVVRDLSIRRTLARVGNRISQSALSSGGLEAHDLLDRAEQDIYKITDQDLSDVSVELDDRFCAELVDWLRERERNASDVTGLRTGLKHFDSMTAGLQKGDLIVIAGRPSQGKTSLAMTIARNAALADKPTGVLVFSLEMSREQLALRMVSSVTGVDFKDLRIGRLGKDWSQVNTAVGEIKNSRLMINDNRMMTVERIRSLVRRIARAERKADRRLGLVVIDYLQLMHAVSPNNRDQNRNLELGSICRSLKALAGDADVPILLLSQLNREVERRPQHKVRLSDLRDSGAIEQDADMVVFVGDPKEENPALRPLYIAKQRNGPTGECEVVFDAPTLTFKNADEAPPSRVGGGTLGPRPGPEDEHVAY